jgi:dolichol-phosphate mannosyltransferase
MNDCIVIIPTYNEIEKYWNNKICAFPTQAFHVLIVDDNSPDHVRDKGCSTSTGIFKDGYSGEKGEKSGRKPLMFMDLKWAWQKIWFYFEMDADSPHNPND